MDLEIWWRLLRLVYCKQILVRGIWLDRKAADSLQGA